ncbi:hypothetical protein HDU86_005574, partial [Geranomyces michiganensis]
MLMPVTAERRSACGGGSRLVGPPTLKGEHGATALPRVPLDRVLREDVGSQGFQTDMGRSPKKGRGRGLDLPLGAVFVSDPVVGHQHEYVSLKLCPDRDNVSSWRFQRWNSRECRNWALEVVQEWREYLGIPQALFDRLVRQITEEQATRMHRGTALAPQHRWQRSAIEALREASKAFIVLRAGRCEPGRSPRQQKDSNVKRHGALEPITGQGPSPVDVPSTNSPEHQQRAIFLRNKKFEPLGQHMPYNDNHENQTNWLQWVMDRQQGMFLPEYTKGADMEKLKKRFATDDINAIRWWIGTCKRLARLCNYFGLGILANMKMLAANKEGSYYNRATDIVTQNLIERVTKGKLVIGTYGEDAEHPHIKKIGLTKSGQPKKKALTGKAERLRGQQKSATAILVVGKVCFHWIEAGEPCILFKVDLK